MLLDCAICDNLGANLVELKGVWQPKPIPEPQYEPIGSEHQMISDDQPGDLVIQDFGVGSPYLEVVLPRVPASIRDGLLVLFLRYVDGRRPSIQFRVGTGDDAIYYKGSLVGSPFKPQRTTKKPFRYAIQFRIRIIELLEEFFVEGP